MLYESFKVSREARRRQHMCQHGKFDKLGSQTAHQKDVFLKNFEICSRRLSGGFWRVWRVDFDVFWCPGGPWTILEWSWIDFGTIIFSQFFIKILTQMSDQPLYFYPLKSDRIEDLIEDSWFLFAWRWEKKYWQAKRSHRFLNLNVLRGQNPQDVIFWKI